MRIISGLAKGRRLSAPRSFLVRPVADKVKGAIFNILGPTENLSVLDLFAGSGSVGLEALSRGAKRAVFVDTLPESLVLLKKNIRLCGFSGQASVIRGRIPFILRVLGRRSGRFDLVFVDPPYDKNLIVPTLSSLAENKLIDVESRVILEHSPRESPEHPDFALIDQRKYGQTLVSFLKSLGA